MQVSGAAMARAFVGVGLIVEHYGNFIEEACIYNLLEVCDQL